MKLISISTVARCGFISIVSASAMAIAMPQASFAQSDPLIGTWHQNVAKSTFSNGPGPRNGNTAIFEADGQGLRLTVEGIDAQSRPTKTVRTMVYDGQPHPVTGTAAYDAMTVKRIDPYTQQWTSLKAGKVLSTATLVISRDSKVAVLTTSGTNANGRQVDNVTVWEKQEAARHSETGNAQEEKVASTKEVLDRHLRSFGARDLDGIMADYAPDVVFLSPRGVFSPDGILQGKAAARQIFQTVFAEFGKPGMSFDLKQVSIQGDYAYIVWSAETADNIYEPASDTFVFKDGKIVAQSFAAKISPKH